MGILDDFLSFAKTPEGMGTISAVAGGMAGARRNAPWNTLGNAAMSGLLGYGQAQDQVLQKRQADQMGQLRDMQISQMNRQLDLNKRLGEALQGGSMQQQAGPAAGLSQSSAAAFGAPELATDGNPSQVQVSAKSPAQTLADAARKAGDYEAYQKAQAMLIEEKKLAPRFATDFRVAMGPDGKPANYLVADDGTLKPAGVGVADKLSFHNVGNRTVGLDNYTGQERSAIRNTLSPDAAASNALGWANNRIAQQNANAPTFNAEAGGWLYKPTQQNPSGGMVVVPMAAKEPTEAQGKTRSFITRMNEAEKILSNPKIGEMPSIGEGIAGSVPILGNFASNMVRDGDRQQYVQAQMDWVRAKLRKESGASIGKDEEENEYRTYFPIQGDTPEVIAQKAQSRRVATEAMNAEAGKGFAKQTAPQARSKSFKLDNGKSVIATVGEDGNYYVTQNGKKFMVQE